MTKLNAIKKNEVIKKQDPITTIGSFSLFPTALIANKKPELDDFEKAYQVLLKYKGAIAWWMGDLINLGKGTFGEKYSQIVDSTDHDIDTIRYWAYVASRVPIALRHPTIAFRTYQLLAKLEADEMKMLVQKILDEDLTSKDVSALTNPHDEKLPEPPPVAAMAFAASIPDLFKSQLQILPVSKWEPQALETVRKTFESAVEDTRKLFGWI